MHLVAHATLSIYIRRKMFVHLIINPHGTLYCGMLRDICGMLRDIAEQSGTVRTYMSDKCMDPLYIDMYTQMILTFTDRAEYT